MNELRKLRLHPVNEVYSILKDGLSTSEKKFLYAAASYVASSYFKVQSPLHIDGRLNVGSPLHIDGRLNVESPLHIDGRLNVQTPLHIDGRLEDLSV